jgi:hypothetical protein
MSGFTLSSLKNSLDEVRAQYYPKNETEKKVQWFLISDLIHILINFMLVGI